MKPRQKYQLKLLKEEAGSDDLLEDKTHKKIADTLCDVIHNGDEGITIGLEGGWGSGKSTVVSILKEKLSGHEDALYFYFDAWAHEGDPLRRVFLESLIEIAESKNDDLQDIKKRISKRKRVAKTRTNSSVTGLGKCLALAALLVPLGAALISGTAREVTVYWGGKPHEIFLAGLFFVLFPAWVLILRGIYLLVNPKKKIWDAENWMFLQGEAVSKTTQEVSEDEERSSIEFERYFGEILDILFSRKGKKKLLIIVDNLDRIDAHDSLKIWSTLQTFLQRKNPTEDTNFLYKKVWVLVPYDNEGLRRLWKSNSRAPSPLSKSFFDKCFQLRIEVPKPILTGWEAFCRYNMGQALVGWSEQEREQVLDVMKSTRESVNDIPSPREIKTYINQVGLLRLHCGNDISIKAIAYFCVQKYLNFKDNKQIENHLMAGGLSVSSPLSYDINREMCGILFGITPDKGYQLLLEPAINKALDQRDQETLKLLCDTHGSAFWMVFDIHARHIARPDSSFQRAIRYSWTVVNGLWSSYPDRCVRFIGHLKSFFSNHPPLEFPKHKNIDEYEAAFILLEAGGYEFLKTWESITELLKGAIAKEDFNFNFGCQALSVLANCQKRNYPGIRLLDGLSIEKWTEWAKASKDEGLNSHRLIGPPRSIVSEISEKIVPGKLIPEGIFSLIEYVKQCGEREWAALIGPIKNHINFNDGTPQNNTHSIEVFHILTLLSIVNENLPSLIKPIVKDYKFYNLAFHFRKRDARKYSAFIMAKCLSSAEFYSLQFPNQSQANQWVGETRKFWQEKNEKDKTRAKFIWDIAKQDSDFGFIWNLCENKDNKLIAEIIRIAAEEGHVKFFNYQDALELFSRSIKLLDEDDSDALLGNLAECFVAFSPIEQEILESQNPDVIKFSKELWLLVRIENSRIVDHVRKMLDSVPNGDWANAFKSDSYLTSLALAIKDKSPDFRLKNYYSDALESFLISWMSGETGVSEWQEYSFLDLISILQNSFQAHLRNSLTNYLIGHEFKGDTEVIAKLINYFDLHKLFNYGKEKFQNAIRDFIEQKNFQALNVINKFIAFDESISFEPQSYFPDIIRQPLIDLVKDTSDTSNKQLLEELASRLGIDLTLEVTDENLNQGQDK